MIEHLSEKSLKSVQVEMVQGNRRVLTGQQGTKTPLGTHAERQHEANANGGGCRVGLHAKSWNEMLEEMEEP